MRTIPSSLPLTRRQRLIWVENNLHRDVPLNTVTTLFEISGDINVEAFCDAFARVVQRHDALRMVLESGGAVLKVRHFKSSERCIDFVDLSSQDVNQVSYDCWLKNRLRRPLSAGQRLFDAALIKREEHFFTFLLNRHHINSDNASSIILHKELEAHYLNIISEGVQIDRPVLSRAASYEQYLRRAAAYEFTESARASEAFWTRRLASKPPPLQFYGADPAVRSALYARVSRTLSIELSRNIQALGRATSPSIVFTASLLAFLRRVTGSEDICIGVPLHNRAKDSEDVVGLIMEICPNRIQIGLSDTLEDLLGKIKQEIEEVRPHRRYAVSSRQAGFEVLFNFLPNVPASFAGHKASYVHSCPLILLESLETADSDEETWRDREKLSLTVQRAEGAQAYVLHFDFNRSVFPDAALRNRAVDHFTVVLRAFLGDQTQAIDAIDILTPQERSRLFFQTTASPVASATPSTVVDLFEVQAASNPNKTAILGSGDSLTYGQLDAEIRKLAAYLSSKGARSGTLVGVFLDRTPKMIVALLAALRAGAAYVPIDPRLPEHRIDLILRDTEPPVLVSETALRTRLGEHRQGRVICLDEIASNAADAIPRSGPAPDDIAYIIYTSGSTGRPKGVPITQAQLSEFLIAMRDCIGIKPQDRVLAATTIAFDIHIVEVFLPLIVGASLAVATDPRTLDGRALAQQIHDQRITLVQATPATFRMLLAFGWAGNPDLTILCGGETLSSGLATSLRARSRALWNLYGPTETTVWATAKKVDKSECRKISIGTPLSGTKIYVLTPAQAPAPIGVPGEIYIGGTRVAHGYHSRPELTQQRFLLDPFTPDTNARMYRTGDFGRVRENLELEFIGRTDNQVKIRGYRVELEEVEACAVQHRAVVACCAAAFTDGSGEVAISIYVETARPDNVFDQSEFLSFLRRQLPDYMVPSRIFVVDRLPRSPMGKIDRGALLQLTVSTKSAPLAQPRDAPATELERKILSIWRQLLKVGELGVSDNFFDAGGHSLLAMTLMLEIETQLGLEISLEAIFDKPTVRGLCTSLGESHARKPAVIVPIRSGQAQKTLYFIHSGSEFSALSDALTGDISTAFVTANGAKRLRQLIGGRDILGTIDRISDAYAQAIFARHQSGPCYLAGHSFGGILAVETACKLEEQGAAPDIIFLFDTYLHGSMHRILYDLLHNRWLARKFREVLQGHRHEVARRVRFLSRSAFDRLIRSAIVEESSASSEEDLHLIFREIREAGTQGYRGPSRPLTSRTVLFRATESIGGGAMRIDPNLGWARHLGANLTVIPMPGDHFSLLKDDHAGVAAGEIERQIGLIATPA